MANRRAPCVSRWGVGTVVHDLQMYWCGTDGMSMVKSTGLYSQATLFMFLYIQRIVQVASQIP